VGNIGGFSFMDSNFRIIIIIFLSCILLSQPVIAQDKQFIIKSINVQGSKTMPPETIIGILQTRVGEEVSRKKIDNDVKELFKLGQFSNIQVDSSGSQDGIDLTFIMEEWPKVSGDIVINGNKEISTSKIKGVLTVGSGQSLSGKLLQENRNKIVSLYKDRGYYLAEVQQNLVTSPEDGSARLSFDISEGNKIAIDEIDITGNRRISDRELKKQMKLKKGKRFDDIYYEADQLALINYYRQNGFVDARMLKAEKQFNDNKTGITIRIELDEGPQYRVGKIQVSIKPYENNKQILTEKDILSYFTLKEGDLFKEMAFEEGIKSIYSMYLDKGRVSVQINPTDIKYKPEEEVVDINLSIVESGPAYIDQVSINWLSETSDEPHKTKDYVIKRELDRFDIKKGKTYSLQNIEDARREILTLGSFIKRADPRPKLSSDLEENNNEQKVAIGFDIEESRQSGMFSIAGGYGSEGGLFGALDIWDDNILGRALRLQLTGEIGTKERRTGEVAFSTPWIFNTPTFLSFRLYNRRRSTNYYPGEEEEAYYRDESAGGSITVGRPITRKLDLSLMLRNENWVTKELLGENWEPRWRGITRSVKVLMDRDTRKYLTSMFDPNGGSYNSISVEASGLGGDEFEKITTESSLFLPTWWKLVLAFQLRTGYITGKYPKIYELRWERFFLGGIDTVRGYDSYSITPDDYAQSGGNQMALLNIEYRIPITDMLRGVIFFDAGQTWGDNEYPWQRFSPRKSVGIGLRVDLLGALARIEYGFPLDPARKGEKIKSGKIHFDFGPAF